MGSLSDTMLTGGCLRHTTAFHGEPVVIISGHHKGKSVTGVLESLSDLQLQTDLGQDPRAKRILRVANDEPLIISAQATVQTGDGRKWTAVQQDFSGYLTRDYLLSEIAPVDVK